MFSMRSSHDLVPIDSVFIYLRTWLQDNPTLSRECVSHAGALIDKIRLSRTMSCYDPFCLLISVLFLWTFEKLKPVSPTELEQAPRSSGSPIIFKIDQCHEESIRERWVRGPRSLGAYHRCWFALKRGRNEAPATRVLTHHELSN
ncbi:hypothetical protein BDV33DRAFT_163759 [Aspergillus novoparasiticus]|uniref:Uncharacterized protein n=1 Tax=Aspergillus novoparasiticus TaxID=986946 RepID=A0A5N6F9V7_9EURO|nr:hypothetical protein BDV33DRAFT_163759 [Aspergillus novoparasiticus]